MAEENIFGRIITGADVRRAMEAHLKAWLPTYLAEVARSQEIDPTKLPAVRSWVSSLDLAEGKYEEHQIPSCVIVAPGLAAEPERRGGGFRVVWAVSVGVVVAGQDRDGTFLLTELYAAAVRAAVLHKPTLGGFAEATDWLGERYDEVENDALRTLAAGSVQFGVTVADALIRPAGPDVPLVDPIPDPGPGATFVSVDAVIEEGESSA